MAFIKENDGTTRWIEYNERADLISDLEEEQTLLLRLIDKDEAEGFDIDRLENVTDELDRLKRVHKGEYDVRYFGITYFSEDGNPGNADNLIPSGVNYDNVVQFHRDLCNMFDDITEGDKKRHVAYACPRSHAKTSWISNIFLVHQLVYRHRKYIVLFSETTDVAGDFTSWGRYQLKLNEKLRNDFGELLYVQPSKNESDNKYEFVTTSRAKVEAKGLGTQTRGLRHGSTRPDLFILDDLESEDSTNTPELIEKSKTWFREAMLPALDKKGICVYLGTILCYGSLLHYVIEERKDFESRTYSAIESFSDREDLWDEWRNIYRSDDENSVDRADEFYEENEDQLLKGTKILWPGYWTYYELVKLKEENGSKAFSQEYMNNPTDEERQVFKPEDFSYFSDKDLEGKNLKYFAGVDMAMGREKGDYSVIVTLAKNVDTDVCYVVDAFIEKLHPDELMEQVVNHTMYYQYSGIGVEAVAFQEFFADQLGEYLKRRGYPSHTRLHKIKHRTRKELRIESMLPDIQNGKLRFHQNLKKSKLIEQFEMYGMVPDDGPDGTQMAYSTAKSGNAIVRTARKRMR